jgi:hypothetical protein
MRSRKIEYPVTEGPAFSDAFKQNLERLSRLFAEFEIASPKAGKQAGKTAGSPRRGNNSEECAARASLPQGMQDFNGLAKPSVPE